MTLSPVVVCSTCGETKSIGDFNRWSRSPTGYRKSCKACQKTYNGQYYQANRETMATKNKAWYEENRESAIARAVKWYHEDPRRKLDSDLKARYGISADDYEKMFAEQGGVCAICFDPPSQRRLAVDHCHVTGRVRSLLCSRCNLAIGLARESAEVLQSMIDYLGRDRHDDT